MLLAVPRLMSIWNGSWDGLGYCHGQTRTKRNPKKNRFAELKAKHFSSKGRKRRIAEALEVVNRPGPTFKLDRDTVKWIAQDVEVENL